MKIANALLREKLHNVATVLLCADKGFELSYEAGILTAKRGEVVYLVPMSNVISMTPQPLVPSSWPKVTETAEPKKK